MSVQTQCAMRNYDVVGTMFYAFNNHKHQELFSETISATSHDEAENRYRELVTEQCEMRSLELDRIELEFVIDLDAAESGESWEKAFGVDETVH
ncbi:hypothetical protein BC490_02945 [Vibrio parahaemolyticus]|uniref:Uncharacterized protein n=1 Tax=Vibrio zhanjiangensis TaxID=1046128 RepID=A0ABQ6EV64_9VIBR|nr:MULTISPECIES: hypothetical protein [Vibrio]RFD48418.1 hypothetical protein H328_000275 [Vibrio parahaemolyticus 3355]EGR0986886.1 hypothetical protein [Vibrio parahaemolyticus]EGR1373100.1 hypothetical protein [Vibrio parahaemolyticus]ELZ1479442.1 hypothetical protein [Vibrio parahaemolyticus]KFA94956.1 hypothetical protein HW45_28520 [Vibrio sp. ER1A]